jgi:hypothetical protein
MLSQSGDGLNQGGTVRNPPEAVTARIPDSISALKCLKVLAETINHGPSANPIPRGELISDSMPGGSDETSKMHEGTLSIKHHLTR